ncbi:hypothetical protein GQE99_10155 [Maritimibacter sp. DP07]|uniref:Uncharacterized protein n=1 Tax=Maritimibacter harenae TaxID=2606218 RepID=A0A845M2Y4_9RHOB|nr:hypothetical protein [Maritimibacter harenae]MZR13379.1 hypothetical protein [Maritimibacter harenae]
MWLFAFYTLFAAALAFVLADRFLWLMDRKAAPRWVGPLVAALLALFVYPFAFLILLGLVNELLGGSSEMLGFMIGVIGGAGLLGGVIGVVLAVLRRRRTRRV